LKVDVLVLAKYSGKTTHTRNNMYQSNNMRILDYDAMTETEGTDAQEVALRVYKRS
jgi:hypothetical protein